MSSIKEPNYPALVFHHSGKSIPHYAKTTLKKIGGRWPGRIILLNNIPGAVSFAGVEDEKYTDWYDPGDFGVYAKKSEMEREFREGFWFHAIERFFILSQWQLQENISNFLHVELDVLVFGSYEALRCLDDYAVGLFLPRASITQAGANWMYVNNPAALRQLVLYFTERAGTGFEMPLLAQFIDARPDLAHAVPTHASFEQPDASGALFATVPREVFGAIVDVHPLGTWIFGQDPRNSPKEPVFNHYYFEELGSPILRSLRFRFSWREKQLYVGLQDREDFPVLALHVHSKVMKRVHSKVFLWVYVWLANRKFRTIIISQRLISFIYSKLRAKTDRIYLILGLTNLSRAVRKT